MLRQTVRLHELFLYNEQTVPLTDVDRIASSEVRFYRPTQNGASFCCWPIKPIRLDYCFDNIGGRA